MESGALSFRKRGRHDEVVASPEPRAEKEASTTKTNVANCLKAILRQATQGVWWKLLPDGSDRNNDIVAATGIDWNNLLPILMLMRLLSAAVTSTVKGYSVQHGVWNDFLHAVTDVNIEITKVQIRGRGHVYYFCVGIPLFKNLVVQERELGQRIKLRSLFLSAKMTDICLKEKTRNISEKIRARNLMGRILNRPAWRQQEEVDEEEEEQRSEVIATYEEQQIHFAFALDLGRRPRRSRYGAIEIDLHERRQANGQERHMVIHTASRWGWRDPFLPYKDRLKVAQAACRQVAYDYGFAKCLAATMLPSWYGSIDKAIMEGESQDPISPSHSGTVAYVNSIEKKEPGYLHELFRHVQGLHGSLASFHELAMAINAQSAVPGEGRPTLSLSRHQVMNWFKANGGKEKSAIEKPLLTDEHKRLRITWARKYYKLFCNRSAPVAFLDEKWFYTTNRRRRLKLLPQGDQEHKKPDAIQRPRIRSRRYPAKVSWRANSCCFAVFVGSYILFQPYCFLIGGHVPWYCCVPTRRA